MMFSNKSPQVEPSASENAETKTQDISSTPKKKMQLLPFSQQHQVNEINKENETM